jgi:hypothetical protein
MALQNRVTPFGEIIATPARGTFMGNRGVLHNGDKKLGSARWRAKAWITCALEFKGRWRTVMGPGTYTELFFLDEATTCAAGHRPCAECRRSDFARFTAAWTSGMDRTAGQRASAKEIDARLHQERISRPGRAKRTFEAPVDHLPDGVMVVRREHPEQALLVLGGSLYPWSPEGYGAPLPRRSGIVHVLTPPSITMAIAAGYRPQLHPTAKPR